MGEGGFGEGNWAVTKGTTTLAVKGGRGAGSYVLKETRMTLNERNGRDVRRWADLENVDNFFPCRRCYTTPRKSPESLFCPQKVTSSSHFFLSVLTSGTEFDVQKGEPSSANRAGSTVTRCKPGLHVGSACCCYVLCGGLLGILHAVQRFPALPEQPS